MNERSNFLSRSTGIGHLRRQRVSAADQTIAGGEEGEVCGVAAGVGGLGAATRVDFIVGRSDSSEFVTETPDEVEAMRAALADA